MDFTEYHAGIVQQLLESATAVLRFIPDSDEKTTLCATLARFDNKIVPTAIELDEVVEYLNQRGVSVETTVASEILINAAYDIDLNCVDSAIEYHANEYAWKLTHAKN
jgi:hypothetical protein